MERLQAALEKARTARGEDTRPVQAKAKRATSRGAVHEAWEAIEPITLDPRRMRRNRIVALSGGREASPVDLLRTKMLQQMRQNNWRRVAVTSPGAGCGKTTVCLNLAASLSRQPEMKTVLVDLDMRRLALADILGIRGRGSFWDVVEGRVSFAEQAVRIGQNVLISVNTQKATNPSEILSNSATARLIDEIEAIYRPDILIFDMPPMLMTDDSLAFLDKVDCGLLVAAAEKTSVSQVDVCERDLAAQTNFLGVTLNQCRYSSGTGYDYSYH
ncbi:CpsD/CapB family tyrosine-protein kinase [Roseitranquillus sediminis]|uniref:CpsD/CapB family tyrosine-protein kinase n=1 Tax=Roseitranquillus sediminis TaxID=2809051 RepID=UPI001D0CCFC5|nr:CpsD/CapB family tyrosine-protein kinase [Roseitranquillus sediminis]MBM9596188.1 CpsD/CapB family tyrosine-protein kinase [Roseitranquillus sediminis]